MRSMSAESNEQSLSEVGAVVVRLPFSYTRRKEKHDHGFTDLLVGRPFPSVLVCWDKIRDKKA